MCEALGMDDPNDRPADSPGARLQWVRRNRTTFYTASQAARAFGWPISTYLGHENGDRVPSRETAKRYGRAYRVPWEWILEGGGLPEDQVSPPSSVALTGEVAAGVWFELGVPDAEPVKDSPFMYDTRYPPGAQEALVVRGTSVNRVAQAGDILHCVRTTALEPVEGDLVIVDRIRSGNGESSAKRYSRRGNIIVLTPDSTDERWKSIEIEEGETTDDDHVLIDAVVIAVYKPLKSK